MRVDSIKNGYVIDHIKSGGAMQIYSVLSLDKLKCSIAIITNAKSEKFQKKDIIKIDSLVDIDFNKIGYIDNNITINKVKNGKIISKLKVVLPEKIVNVAKCKNPRCITSQEQNLDQIFVLHNSKKSEYRCIYCESLLN